MLNHKLEADYLEAILQPAIGAACREGKRLVVIAPYYDSFLLQKFSRDIALEFKATKTTTVVYTRASLMDDYRADLFNDYAALCGCTIINENTACEILKGELEFDPNEYLGEVGEMDIGEQSTFTTGFDHKNESMLSILEKDALSKYNELVEGSQTASTITEALVNAKQRMSKLKCNMGIINVGGSTELAKIANYDLVEDAVKACESAYLFGVTPGQTIGIQTAIRDLKASEKYKDKKIEQMFLDAISKAYRDVTKILLENKFKENISDNVMNKLVNLSIENQSVIDLENTEIEFVKIVGFEDITDKDGNILQKLLYKLEKFFGIKDIDNIIELEPEAVIKEVQLDDTIINSCKTDIEVLRATSGIIGLLLSSNQYVAVRF
jgi:hypothetical protein